MTHAASARAVFFDRAGVLNEALVRGGLSFSPMSVDDVVVPSDVPDAMSRLWQNRSRFIMVTNQTNIARKMGARKSVDEINRNLSDRLKIHAVAICEHDDNGACDCRKREPGMLLRAFDRDRVAPVGDRGRVIDAGRHAACRAIMWLRRQE